MDNIFKTINKIVKIDRNQFNMLNDYINFLLNYNNKINLIGKSTINDIWNRHIIDSLQIMKLIKNNNLSVADLGSGAGLPGIPISIAGIKNITLFEKSPRKCEFLNEAKKFSNNKIIIENKNLNDVKNKNFDIIVSRALANLDMLLNFSNNLKKPSTQLIFLKGKKIYEEIDEAKKNWNIQYQLFDSITSEEGKIIQITDFRSKKLI